MSDKKTTAAKAAGPKAALQPFYFPEDGITVEAATLEEAQAQLEARKAGRK